MSVRQLTAGDLPKIREIISKIRNFSEEEKKVAEELVTQSLGDVSDYPYITFVAESEGSIAGFVNFGIEPMTRSSYEIFWIAVQDDLHGRGIGSELMQGCLEHIRKLGGKRVFLETSSKIDYTDTRRFYFKHGFSEIVRIKDYYDEGDDLIKYRKVIA